MVKQTENDGALNCKSQIENTGQSPWKTEAVSVLVILCQFCHLSVAFKVHWTHHSSQRGCGKKLHGLLSILLLLLPVISAFVSFYLLQYNYSSYSLGTVECIYVRESGQFPEKYWFLSRFLLRCMMDLERLSCAIWYTGVRRYLTGRQTKPGVFSPLTVQTHAASAITNVSIMGGSAEAWMWQGMPPTFYSLIDFFRVYVWREN